MDDSGCRSAGGSTRLMVASLLSPVLLPEFIKFVKGKCENLLCGPITLLLVFLVHCLENSGIGSEPLGAEGNSSFDPVIRLEVQLCHIIWSHSYCVPVDIE